MAEAVPVAEAPGGLVVEDGGHAFALVRGAPWRDVPRDLYIPPDALEVVLEAFTGPLDLLLYLIKRHNLDVLDIPIAEVTRQYVQYIDLMKELKLELAAEYLLMAATLAEIKSRMLLPRPAPERPEDDPRAELVRRLQEYERIKQAACGLDGLPRVGRELFATRLEPPAVTGARPAPRVSLGDLLAAMQALMARAELFAHHHVRREPLSVRERMTQLLERLVDGRFRELAACLDPGEGRAGVVVTLLALLELLKDGLVELVQNEPFGPVHVRVAG